MSARFDVVVVGARCAGSALAIELARAGVSVCVVDRAVFPSETLSTHAIQACGVQALGELGVRGEVEATTAPITRARIALGRAQAQVEDVPGLLGAPMLNVRRVTLDEILVRAAARAGADVRCDTSVTGLASEGGRVTGVRTKHGPVTARVVVGADGMRSDVAEHVRAGEYAATRAGRVFVWGYLSGVDLAATDVASTIWLGKPHLNGFLASPTDAGLFMAVATVDADRKAEFAADREAGYRAAFAEWPQLAEVVAAGRPQGPVRMVAGWHGYFRESAGPGWALVGDAGHFKDPTPGQGISDAFRQAHRLAAAIQDGLHNPDRLDGALGQYWRWRDEDAWSMYWFAHDLGAPGPTPPLQAEVQRLIASEPTLTQRLARVLNHDHDPAELTPPRVIARAAAAAFSHPTVPRRHLIKEAASLARDERHRRHLRGKQPPGNLRPPPARAHTPA